MNDAKLLAEWVKLKWEFGLRDIPDEVLMAAQRVLANQPAATETGPTFCPHEARGLRCLRMAGHAGVHTFEHLHDSLTMADTETCGPCQRTVYECSDGTCRVCLRCVAAETNRALAARLGATMTAGVVVTEPQGAPSAEVYWAGAPYQRENREAHERLMAHLRGEPQGAPQTDQGEPRCKRCEGAGVIDSWECTLPCPDCTNACEVVK